MERYTDMGSEEKAENELEQQEELSAEKKGIRPLLYLSITIRIL